MDGIKKYYLQTEMLEEIFSAKMASESPEIYALCEVYKGQGQLFVDEESCLESGISSDS